ncbi:MAG: 50S ribosomal protein L29 [Endomicrobiales bacterium]|nr:50S ribosomal protein L29 [Endomicrobiales bacterium]
MKNKVWQEMRSLSKIELEAKLRDIEEELFRFKFKHSSTPIKNPLTIRITKRTIAKIKTLLKEKENEKE